MASFKQKFLEPLVTSANGRIDAALGLDDITSKTDSLLAAREETATAFGGAARREVFRMVGAGLLAAVGAVATWGGVSTALSVIAVLAGTTGAAIPLAILGVAAVAGGATLFSGAAKNYNQVKNAWNALTKKTDQEVTTLVKAYPQETAKSSRLAAFLKGKFNPAASADKPETGPAPATPAPQPAAPANS